MKNVSLQIKHENWAYTHGFNNEVQIALVADFLNGLNASAGQIEPSLVVLPNGIFISKTIREIFYNEGNKLSKIKCTIDEVDILKNLGDLFKNFHSTIMSILKENSILASTGDCRGACAYNTGDRSEYRNYGW